MHKKARKQFAENKQTKYMDYWNHVLWSDETKINLFGSDGVKRVWRQPGEECKEKCVLPTVKHDGESVWGCAAGELQFIEGTWMPTCTVTYWSRAWSPPFGNWAAGQCPCPRQNIDTLSPIWTFSLRGELTFWSHIIKLKKYTFMCCKFMCSRGSNG